MLLFENCLVLLFSLLLLVCSFSVVVSKNTVYSVLFLILSFLSAASLLFLFECEFLALILIMIYVGATAVLFLFVIMMLEIKNISNSTKDIIKYFPIGSFFGLVIVNLIGFYLLDFFSSNYYKNCDFIFNFTYSNWFNLVEYCFNIEIFGLILYSYCFIQFLLAGFILLLAILGSVVLTSNKEFHDYQNNNQLSFKQIIRTSEL